MKTAPIITLTTDFGRRDSYSGAMKGVILGICPRAAVVDLSHELGPQDIREASLLLAACAPFFPPRTIHVVVVDPEVGSERKIICAKTSSAYFIAPDNGVLTAVLREEDRPVIREVSNRAFFRKKISATFHGRDKFAPAAAHLAAKDIFAKMGTRLKYVRTLDWPAPSIRKKRVAGEVIHVDRFGNLITNIRADQLRNFELPPADIRVGRNKVSFWGRYYAEGRKGRPMALFDSSDRVEIAVPLGSAAASLRASVGAPVILEWK